MKVKLKYKSSERVNELDIEHAQRVIKWRPNLYELVDEKFELVNGDIKRRTNKRSDKESKGEK